jgi:hypothetical protein
MGDGATDFVLNFRPAVIRLLGVPLAQLTGVGVDEPTAEAIGDWYYWVAQGYCLRFDWTISQLSPTGASRSRFRPATDSRSRVTKSFFRCSISLGLYYSGLPEEADDWSGLALIPRSRLSTVACSLVAVTRSRMLRAYTATN